MRGHPTVVTRSFHVPLVAIWCVVLCMAHEGGCHGEAGATRPSPVNAIGMVLEHDDGSIEARLSVRSDTLEPAVPVAANDVVLSRGADRFALAGKEETYATTVDEIGYEPEMPFTLGFALSAAGARDGRVYAGRFAMSAHGPWERPVAWLEGHELLWTPGGLPAYVEVRDASGERTWRSFDPSAEAPDYAALVPGGMRLPDHAFSGEDVHEILVCAVEAMTRDQLTASTQHVTVGVDAEGQLGWLSGMVVGRCVTLVR